MQFYSRKGATFIEIAILESLENEIGYVDQIRVTGSFAMGDKIFFNLIKNQ
ncbi:hypothetical protein L3i20_v233830 [Paenibacillus sp. L3-i20]|nr:hypothetical protein L3i20_v233830 [Paenibacillus sp. L3-i20]